VINSEKKDVTFPSFEEVHTGKPGYCSFGKGDYTSLIIDKEMAKRISKTAFKGCIAALLLDAIEHRAYFVINEESGAMPKTCVFNLPYKGLFTTLLLIESFNLKQYFDTKGDIELDITRDSIDLRDLTRDYMSFVINYTEYNGGYDRKLYEMEYDLVLSSLPSLNALILSHNPKMLDDICCYSLDTTRPDFTGVFFNDQNDLVATDGHRLSKITNTHNDNTLFISKKDLDKSQKNIIIPLELFRSAAKKKEKIAVYRGIKNTNVVLEERVLSDASTYERFEIIAGRFPDFSKVFPEEKYINTRFTLDVNKTLEYITRYTDTSKTKKSTQSMLLQTDGNKTTLAFRKGDKEKAIEGINASVCIDRFKGKNVTVALSPNYLKDLLSAFPKKEYLTLGVEYVDQDSPVVFHCIEYGVDYIIMPMQW
jgi:hypothetical protein